MQTFLKSAVLTAALLAPLAFTPPVLRADDDHRRDERTYHDQKFKDDHAWNGDEDRSYRIWVKENHRKYRDFNRINQTDQQRYWEWRHEHSDHDEHRENH